MLQIRHDDRAIFGDVTSKHAHAFAVCTDVTVNRGDIPGHNFHSVGGVRAIASNNFVIDVGAVIERVREYTNVVRVEIDGAVLKKIEIVYHSAGNTGVMITLATTPNGLTKISGQMPMMSASTTKQRKWLCSFRMFFRRTLIRLDAEGWLRGNYGCLGRCV